MEFPSNAQAMELLDQLRDATENLGETQDRMLALSGVAWSDDQTVKVEVGPRGQLVNIEIDPKVFRQPDAQALSVSIVQANTAAVQDVFQQAREIIENQLPPEIAELRREFVPDEPDQLSEILRTDADIVAERKAEQ